MYEVFEKLLKIKGVKASDVTRATGISSTVFSDWKSGKSKPGAEKLIEIADYFGVSVRYILTGKDKEKQPLFSEEQEELLILYNKLSKEQKGNILNMLRSFAPKK